jgi:hypothetical protein
MSIAAFNSQGQVVDAYEEWYGQKGQKLALTLSKAWVDNNGNVPDALREMCRDAVAEIPNARFYGYRREKVLDGAGAQHVTVTVYFTEPEDDGSPKMQLDPRNLNEAPVMAFGQLITGDELRQMDVGQIEQDIKRTPRSQ